MACLQTAEVGLTQPAQATTPEGGNPATADPVPPSSRINCIEIGALLAWNRRDIGTPAGRNRGPVAQGEKTIKRPGLLVADDHEIYRDGLVALIQDSMEFEHASGAGSLEEVLEHLGGGTTVGLVILDLNMPGMEGPSSLAAIKQIDPELKIVVLSASDSRDDVLAALASGAHGYVWKGSNNDEIVAALNAVMLGTIHVPNFMAEPVRATSTAADSDAPASEIDVSRFTPRQSDVLLLLAQGLSNKEIARELDLSESTIKIHVTAILRELGARNRTQAVVMAQGLGKATPPADKTC